MKKSRFKGIRFNTWLYFLGFSLFILVILGVLLVVFIRPYYRDEKIKSVDMFVETIEEKMIDNQASKNDIDEISKVAISNSACALIYNENAKKVYTSPSLGSLCSLNEAITIDSEEINIENEPTKLISALDKYGVISISKDSSLLNNSMLVYCKKIESNLATYYLAINTPLEPVESYITFILNQYSYMAIFVIILSLIIGYFLSSRISSPIIKMKKEANKLAEGNYNVDFKSDNQLLEINELATTLDEATNKLEKIDELRKDLVANVSHDIKTPLTMIQAYAEMIRDISGNDEKKRNEHIDVILKEVDYLNHLVTDMQELSKMQAGIIELNNGNFELDEIIRDVIELLKHFADERKVTINQDLSSVTVFGDEIKISQVVYNFLSNAIKHSSENSEVSIRMIDSEEKIRVEVVDNGDGIKEEMLPFIWDRYYKVDKNFARTKDSTGLGLAIAKAILEAHKATYGVKSKENEGSMFYFELNKEYNDEDERLS